MQGITIMRLSVRTGRKYSYIVYPSEVVVYDDCGNTVVKYPTEEESKEYIRNQESEAKDDI